MTPSTALLNSDGTWAIAWEPTVARIDGARLLSNAAGLAAGAGVGGVGRVEVRAGCARRVRTYTLRRGQATGAEVDLVRQALEESRHGAEAVRWRHETDDAAAIAEEAPLFRIVGESIVIGRGDGGVVGDVSLVLEEV